MIFKRRQKDQKGHASRARRYWPVFAALALIIILLVALLPPLLLRRAKASDSAPLGLTIETTAGPVTGFVDDTTPNVAQFLGIPYAEQPVGERRWLPAVTKAREESIDATNFGKNCPQIEDNSPGITRNDVPEFIVPVDDIGEECLVLNVWAPRGSKKGRTERLPVIVWIYGGGFQNGGGNVQYLNPSRWVNRSQKLVVVGINYRSNIFGFPNARGLKSNEQNLGLLDQRLGLEWIRSNIENFGGDPSRISLWGHSAGAVAADLYNFAYPDDPIIAGLILSSGSTFFNIASNDREQTNFTFVASQLGCGELGPQEELDCLRKVSSEEITSFRKDYNSAPGISFNPIIDNSTKFSNNTARAYDGKFAKVPAIAGSTTNEGALFQPYNRTHGPNQASANRTTLSLFHCPVVGTTQLRHSVEALTFNYLYGGNFSNISPQWWQGAYHSAELPLLFGTHGIARGTSPRFEVEVSEQMQDFWLAFAEDPVNGLPKLGWDASAPGGDGILIGWEGEVTQRISQSRLEEPCDGPRAKEDGRPPP
ncbi:para-nitrobenzyl esterase [Aaosphaeria arxii CBS 175.79]|uniref:Carboxylic ester hydrolase n=1 Tax=Aaosphaeria arxii CBS 175.79 TaxID=1450172 RepID=A0A6A5X7V3_9PLEO|nr:para-nitrobenzyl esterase [Aaosphaeria arxii CBS 175.79]KAF2009115.1 para-nitrobenzyl esterase [Aaosphaeria arxii CBS 175.79]